MELSPQSEKRAQTLYYLYLDESGHAEFNPQRSYRDVNSRYLTVAGVLVRADEYLKKLEPEILKLKQQYFGRVDIMLHYTDIFMKRGLSVLKEEDRARFWRDFLTILRASDVILQAITVDKQGMQETYSKFLVDPYHMIIAWHIERVIYTLARIEKGEKLIAKGARPLQAKVIIEARSGGNDPRTGEEIGPDRRLARSYRKVYQEGTTFFNDRLTPAEIQRRLVSREIKVVEKRMNKTGLQVADLVCFPLHWNTLFELCSRDLKNLMGDVKKNRNVELFWDVLRDKIACDDKGNPKGWGIKIFPEGELF
jgi:hypothetical protein